MESDILSIFNAELSTNGLEIIIENTLYSFAFLVFSLQQ